MKTTSNCGPRSARESGGKHKQSGEERSTNNYHSWLRSNHITISSIEEGSESTSFGPNYPVNRSSSRKSDSTSKVYAARKLAAWTCLPSVSELGYVNVIHNESSMLPVKIYRSPFNIQRPDFPSIIASSTSSFSSSSIVAIDIDRDGRRRTLRLPSSTAPAIKFSFLVGWQELRSKRTSGRREKTREIQTAWPGIDQREVVRSFHK